MKLQTLLTALLVFGLSASCSSIKDPGSKENSSEYPLVKWDLSDLFKSKKDWSSARAKLKEEFKPLMACKGKLTRSSSQLYVCLEKMFAVKLKLSEISSWAGLQKSADSMSSETSEMTDQARDLFSQYAQSISFFAPEISKAGRKKILRFQRENRKLASYSQYLRDIFVQSKHILGPNEEAVISAFRPVIGNASSTYGLLSNADIIWPTVKLSTGDAVIDVAGYSKYRQSRNRSDRRKVFDAFYGTLKKYERTFGSTLSQSIKSRTIEAKLRNYDGALSNALGSGNIPQEVYRTLVEQVNDSLPTFHRYLKIRKHLLGVKNQEYIDIYPSVVESENKFPIEKARQMTIEAVAPLGDDYVTRLSSATQKNWMDIYPRKGKRSGAFMSGSAYNHHPYVFLNHQDDYNSVSTYAHEWGHAMHTIYSNDNQPYAKARYSIFVAEIAAIVNEALLLEKAVQEAKSDEEKLFYLDYTLEFIRGTYFRQTQFSEFELKLHEIIENGGALSGQKISKIYGEIVRKYYGHGQGVMEVNEKFFPEWAFVPHFYYGFYVYQYSTSISAAYYFAEKILNGDKDVLRRYQAVLKAGGSKYPHEILLDAGLDMTKPDSYKAIERKANRVMDEMEMILKKQGRLPKV